MSLHKFAEQVASQGRGDDSLLVHMTPDEVQRLQAFAEANGRSLTINPTTGLPEAGFLSDLFKAVAPIALGAFLGPGAFGIAGMGLSAGTAGLITGGITSLATGSLSRGLMAGLGAYGGAGLAESFMGAGGNALVAGGAPIGAENLAGGVSSSGATAGSAVSVPPIEQVNPSNFNLSAADKFNAGAKAAMADPMAFAKNNLGNLAYAAAPIAAGLMVPTTTKLGEPKDTGLIRQFDYNINPDTGRPDPLYGMRAMTPVKASEFGNKTFQGQRDLFRQQNPNPYELGVGSLNQPPQQQQQTTPMASGGIVALAGGGDIPGYAAGGYKPTDTEIFNYFKTPGLTDAQIAADMQKFTVSAADIARATGTQNQQADYEKRFVNTLVSPTTDASDFQKATSAVGLQDQALATAMQNAGLSQGAQYALTQPAQNDIGFTGGIIDSGTGKAVDLYNQIGYTAGALPGDQGGLEGLYGNINYTATGLQNLIDTGKMSVADAQNAALAELARTGVSVADVKAATGTDFGNLFKPKTVTPITPLPQPFTPIVPGGIKLPGATVYDNGAYGNYGSGNVTGTDYRGNTVSIATPGDIITNPDGTRTVVPNIPGRPYGGFTGMEGVKSAYTAGGGSLGYTSPVRKDPEAYYNKMTDDSLDAYNFLMGKGKNLTQRKAETRDRPVMQRYDEAVLGKKITKPVVKTTTTAKTDTTKVLNSDGTVNQEETDKANFDYAAYLKANPDVQAELDKGIANFGTKDDLASAAYNHYVIYGKAQKRPLRAAEGGMMGYAVGGGIGSLGSYSDGGRLLKGPGDGVSDSIPATIGDKQQPARLADGEFVVPARIVSELGNGSTEAGAKKLYAMMDRVQRARRKTTGKNKVAANSRADKYLPA
jgi:hypothetical protein